MYLFYNEDQVRMTQTYRTIFFRLAYYYSLDSTKHSEAEAVLNRLQEVIPSTTVPMDYRIEYDIAMLYDRLGNKQKFNEMINNVEIKAIEDLENNPNNFQSYYNPYRVLLDVYEAKGEYQKALDLLNRLAAAGVNDVSIRQKMESIKQKMNNEQPK